MHQQVGQPAGGEHLDEAAEAHQHRNALRRLGAELVPDRVIDLAQLGLRDAPQHGQPAARVDHVLHRQRQVLGAHQGHIAEVHGVEHGRHGCLVPFRIHAIRMGGRRLRRCSLRNWTIE